MITKHFREHAALKKKSLNITDIKRKKVCVVCGHQETMTLMKHVCPHCHTNGSLTII